MSTVFVLVAACRKGLIEKDDCVRCVRELPSHGCRLSSRLYAEVLDALGG